jgi:glycosyltransferase involved in cell wall biosynthesis
VLADIPSLRENWDGAAVFVPPNDTDALEAALRELIQNPGLRACLQRSARARSRRFSAARMAQGYMEAYRACVS